MNSCVEEVTFEEKWKGLANTFTFTFACLVAYLESMHGRGEVDRFLAFTSNQARSMYSPLKGEVFEEVAARVFTAGQSFFDIQNLDTSPQAYSVETACLMRPILEQMRLRSDLVCHFCDHVIKPAVTSASGYKMEIKRTPNACTITLVTS